MVALTGSKGQHGLQLLENVKSKFHMLSETLVRVDIIASKAGFEYNIRTYNHTRSCILFTRRSGQP